MPTKKIIARRTPKNLTNTLYCYVESANGKFVRTAYKAKGHESYSEYVNALISKERGVRAPKTKTA